MEDLINRLINIVQETAPELWRIAVRQALIDGWIKLATAIIFIGLLALALYAIRKTWKQFQAIEEANDGKGRWDRESTEDQGMMMFVFSLAAIICLLIVAINLADAAKYLLNPEYRAIEQLLGLIQ